MNLFKSWIAKYQFRGMRDGAEAAELARIAARQDVPEASVQVLWTRNTSPGRYTVAVRRVRD